MATYQLQFIDNQSGPFFAFKLGWSFDDWDAAKLELTDSGAGIWTVPVDEGVWFVFEGVGTPTLWSDACSSPFVAGSSLPVSGGDYQVSIKTERNDGGHPVSGAKVTVLSSGVAIASAYTDASGFVHVLLSAGDYTININAYLFDDVVGEQLVVTSAMTHVVELTTDSITPVPTTGLCAVRFVIRSTDGVTPIAGATVEASLASNVAIESVVLTNSVTRAVTDSNGTCDLILVQGDSIIKGSKLYRIRAFDPRDEDACKPIVDFRAEVPSDETFIYAEQLIPS